MSRLLEWASRPALRPAQSGSTRSSRWRLAGRWVLAAGLLWAAGQSVIHGGALNLLLAGGQLAMGTLVVLRGERATSLAAAALTLLPRPVSAVRAWTAELPVSCKCARSKHAAPALLSWTGASLVVHVLLIALAVTLARRKDAANRE